MGKMKRLIVAVIIFTVVIVMALRGCPRVRKRANIAHDPATAGVTGIARTIGASGGRWPVIS